MASTSGPSPEERSSLLEYVAASQLLPAVRAALGFALETAGGGGALRFRAFRVLAQRFERETVHALLLALEWYCFAANRTAPRRADGAGAGAGAASASASVSTASFAEDMYGLKRTAGARGRRRARAALLASPLACAALSVLPMYAEERLRERAKAEREREEERQDGEGGRAHFWRRTVAVWEAVGVAYSFLYLVKVRGVSTHTPRRRRAARVSRPCARRRGR